LSAENADAKSRIYYYQSEEEKSKKMKANLDGIVQQKIIEIKELELMDKQLRSKYENFKKLSEKALIGDIEQLVSGVIAERRTYDRELLSEFLKSNAPAIMEGVKCDVATTTRVATNISHSFKRPGTDYGKNFARSAT
jgi:hypothetical protein